MKLAHLPSAGFCCLILAGLVGWPTQASADRTDPEAARISTARHSLEWNWTPPGHAGRYGHAETLIRAPIDAVRARVLDFEHYRDISAHFKKSLIVGYAPDHTDVYIRVGVFHDIVSLWDVMRFAPVHELSPGVEVLEGRMVPGKGNVQDMNAVWTMHALEGGFTLLKFDFLIKSGLPAPQSAIDETLRDAARNAVDLIHDRAQGSRDIAAWP